MNIIAPFPSSVHYHYRSNDDLPIHQKLDFAQRKKNNPYQLIRSIISQKKNFFKIETLKSALLADAAAASTLPQTV